MSTKCFLRLFRKNVMQAKQMHLVCVMKDIFYQTLTKNVMFTKE